MSLLKAQDHGFFNQVWLEQGLSQSSIISIIQDKQGFMWFATQDGLNRYDGRNIDHFNFKPFDKQSISGDDIYSISLDKNALFVLNDKGLDYIDLENLKISNLKSAQEKEGKTVFFKSWILNNKLYLLSKDGLAKANTINKNNFDFEYCVFVDSGPASIKPVVYAVCADNNENIYAATSNGIFIQKKGKENFVKMFVFDTKTNLKADNNYSTIYYKNNKLYFTNSSTLFSLSISDKRLHTISLQNYNTFSAILIDNQNKIWIGTSKKGLLLLNQNENDSLYLEKHFVKNNNSRFTLQSNEVTSLYQNEGSQNDVVWIGTRDAGAFNYSYSKNSFSIPTSFVSTSDPNFFGITKDKDDVIWAGFNSGILRIDRNKKEHQIIDIEEELRKLNRPIEALCTDSENNVWTAYGNGLYLVDKKNKTLITKIKPLVPNKANHVSRIVQLNNEELLLTTSRGIIIYNLKANTTKLINTIDVKGKKVSIENINSFLKDSKNNWWIGGANGLYCVREDKKNFILRHNNNDSNSILSNRIMDIKETNKGEILVATTKGLTIINDKGIKNIYASKNLLNNFIYGLVEDNNGRFWMSTNFGLSVFDPVNFAFKSYVASDGICINEFNSGGFFKGFDGEIIFGGLGGLVSIYPEKQITSKSVSDIVLRKTKIENFTEPINFTEPLSLSYWQNDVLFEFSVPDYSGEKNLNLYYRFKNKDTTLIKVNTSQLFSLSFINIAPGNYDLEVLAINKEGARSKPFNFSFKINDPFWTTWWFYLILILITVFVSWLIYRSRLKRKITYIQQIEQIRKDENEKVRKAAALDLHDEFGNGLTRISMLIEMIKLQVQKENNEAHKLLELISQNSNRLYHGTKDFIWSINPGKDNLYEIGIRIKDYADEIFYGTNMTFEITGLDEELKQIKQLPTNGRNITMIFKESLSNVSKHAKASKATLNIRVNHEKIYFTLKDNGVGFAMKDYKNSFGISNIHQRTNRLNAKISILSEENKGTETVLVINKNTNENDNTGN